VFSVLNARGDDLCALKRIKIVLLESRTRRAMTNGVTERENDRVITAEDVLNLFTYPQMRKVVDITIQGNVKP